MLIRSPSYVGRYALNVMVNVGNMLSKLISKFLKHLLNIQKQIVGQMPVFLSKWRSQARSGRAHGTYADL